MGMIRIPSIGNDRIAYVVSRGFDPSTSIDSGLGPYMKVYDTYGDGMTQHGPFYPVMEDNAIDFFHSLAASSFAHPETAREASRFWPEKVHEKYFVLASRIKTTTSRLDGVQNKTLYYNKRTLETSSSKRYEYDEKWAPVPEWANGGLDSAFHLLHGALLANTFADTGLSRLALYVQLHDWFLHEQNWVFPDHENLHGLVTEDPDGLRRAFKMAGDAIEARRLLRRVEKQMETCGKRSEAGPETGRKRQSMSRAPGM